MVEAAKITNKHFPIITGLLFWCGLVIVSSVYSTIPLVSIFAAQFHVSFSEAAWTTSVFSLCYAIGFLLVGPLSDRYGRKTIIVIGLFLLTVFTTLIGFCHQFIWVVIFRGIQGLAAASFGPTALTYIVEMFPSRFRVIAIGFVSTGFLLAGIVGQVVSSFISQQMSWHFVFFLFGIVYFVSACAVALLLPKGEVLNNSANFRASFRAFRTVIVQKELLLCYAVAVTLLFSFVGMYTTLESFLSTAPFHLDAKQIVAVRAVGIIGMLLSPLTGYFLQRFTLSIVLRWSIALAVFGLACLGFSRNLPLVLLMSVLFVAGIAVVIPTLISFVGQLGGSARGAAVSVYTFLLFIGATFGPLCAIQLMNWGSHLLAFEALACILGIGFIVAMFIRQRGEVI